MSVKEGQATVLATLADGSASIEVHLFGATVTSWKYHGKELLFVSKRSNFNNKAAIRGGIPIVFPNFGPWTNGRPQHGFARTSMWKLESSRTSSDAVTLTFELADTPETLALWDHKFHLQYVLELRESTFEQTLFICNMGDTDFEFTTLLHTYFACDDIANVAISGLQGLEFTDKTKGGARDTEHRSSITLPTYTDRVYISSPEQHEITGLPHRITLNKENLRDTVVWNPYEVAANMSDLGDDQSRSFVCVEAGSVATPVQLASQACWRASQLLKVHEE